MAVTPRSCEVVELLGQAAEVADAVAVAVVEGADVHLVDDRVLVPERVVAARRRRARRTISARCFLLRSSSSRGRQSAGCAPGACRGSSSMTRVVASATSRGRPRAGRWHLDSARAGSQVPARRDAAEACRPRRACGIEVDDGQHGVAPIGGLLGVREQRVVVDVMEHEPLVRLQGRVLAADPVDLADQRSEGVRALQVPAADLVLLRVQVLLAAGLARDVLAQLERRAVDPVDAASVAAMTSAPRTSAGRRSAASRGGCPACSARSSGGRTRAPAAGELLQVLGQLLLRGCAT